MWAVASERVDPLGVPNINEGKLIGDKIVDTKITLFHFDEPARPMIRKSASFVSTLRVSSVEFDE